MVERFQVSRELKQPLALATITTLQGQHFSLDLTIFFIIKTEVTHSDLKNQGKVNVGKVLWEEPTGRGRKWWETNKDRKREQRGIYL